jgi:hypothetical protein
MIGQVELQRVQWQQQALFVHVQYADYSGIGFKGRKEMEQSLAA